MKLRLDLNNFDACPQYNDWLDQQYIEQRIHPLDILGFQPRPSFVLFSLSQVTYQASFADFGEQRQEDLKQTVFNEFPSPIAHYFYRFENGYENDLQRLHLLRDTWEAIIDVLHAVAVAECRFRQIQLSEPIGFSHLLSDSVAQRLLNIERIITYGSDLGFTLGISKIVSVPALQCMRELNQSRNGFSHSAAQSEAQARAWISECYEDVVDVLDELRSLADVQILRYMGQVDGNTLRCEVFVGHGFTRTIRNIGLTTEQVRESQCYFLQGQILLFCDGCLFALRPLVYFREDISGHVTKLCMFRKSRGDVPNRRMEYEVVGEAARLEQDRTLFKAEIDELLILEERLRQTLVRLNPSLPPEALEDAFNKLSHADAPTQEAHNRVIHRMLTDGISVEYRIDGEIRGAQAWVLDFEDPENNDWLAVNQFTVNENRRVRRPDIVLFVNGLPLAVIELKNAAAENATIWTAFQQLQTYKSAIPSLFAFNEALVVSDGVQARIGTLTANREWFLPWRTITGSEVATAQLSELQVILEGVFEKSRFLNLVRHFIVLRI